MTIEKSFIDSFVRSTERGAYGASKFRGKNDKIGADKAAVDEMRRYLNTVNMSGTVVIGEGELDEAPMLYINEKLGTNTDWSKELDTYSDAEIAYCLNDVLFLPKIKSALVFPTLTE